jgi:hypothetical protein
MDAEKKVKKGTAEKRGVRKATKTNLKPTKEVDLKAAAEGSDLIQPEVAETPTTPRKKGNRRGSGLSSEKAAPDTTTVTPSLGEPTAMALTGETVMTVQAGPSTGEEPTVEQIQLRAYFISERRKSAGLPGDETGDWVQAREELRKEPNAV